MPLMDSGISNDGRSQEFHILGWIENKWMAGHDQETQLL